MQTVPSTVKEVAAMRERARYEKYDMAQPNTQEIASMLTPKVFQLMVADSPVPEPMKIRGMQAIRFV